MGTSWSCWRKTSRMQATRLRNHYTGRWSAKTTISSEQCWKLMQLSTEITRRKKKTHQLLAELDGSILVALLLPLAASAEDADPPEPRRGHRRHVHHLRCFFLLDLHLHVIFCVHLPHYIVLAPCLCSPSLQQWWHSRMERYPTTAWLALLHSIAPPLCGYIY